MQTKSERLCILFHAHSHSLKDSRLYLYLSRDCLCLRTFSPHLDACYSSPVWHHNCTPLWRALGSSKLYSSCTLMAHLFSKAKVQTPKWASLPSHSCSHSHSGTQVLSIINDHQGTCARGSLTSPGYLPEPGEDQIAWLMPHPVETFSLCRPSSEYLRLLVLVHVHIQDSRFYLCWWSSRGHICSRWSHFP